MTQPSSLSSEGKPPVAASAPAEQVFESRKDGLRLHYSADWVAKKSPDDLLMLVPQSGTADRSITVDVPNVPFHLPGAMTMSLIENGFVDDLRKHHPGLKVEEAKDQTVAGSKARFVRSTWKQNGADFTDAALLIVHGEKVYILSLDCDMPGYPATRAAMDAIASSLEWIK